MKLHRLTYLAVLCLVPCLAFSAEPELALLGDFVEMAPPRALGGDACLVEMVNASNIELNVSLGKGSTSLKAQERVIARIAPGNLDVTITAREGGVMPLEGTLQFEGGHRYELAVKTGPATERVPATLAPAQLDPSATGEPQIAPAPMPTEARSGQVPTRDGKRRHVDVGRKKRK